MALFDHDVRAALALMFAAACSLHDPPAPAVPTADPLPADPPLTLDTMQVECDALLAALHTYKECENLEAGEEAKIGRWIEVAEEDFAAGKKSKPEPNAQKAIAGACRRATDSVKAANERCLAGPRPKGVVPMPLSEDGNGGNDDE